MATPKAPAGGKPKLGSKTIIKQEFANRRESMIREKELDSYLFREQLGISPSGDMKQFIKGVIKSLSKRIRT